ncbi:MAG: PHP domain-containing protein [Candidatus Heimdallarchaeaceae archaeon]
MSIGAWIHKYSIHLSIYLVISLSIIVGSVFMHQKGPQPYKYTNSSWEEVQPFVPSTNISYDILFDQHSHTKYSDGVLTVEQNIRWHIAMGYKGIAITDHNTLRNSKEIEELAEVFSSQILVLQGMEWTTNRIHMNFIGITEWNLKIPTNPTNDEIQNAIIEVHNQDGIVTANHYLWTSKTAENVPTREQLLSWGVDFIEIVNHEDFDQDSLDFCLVHNDTLGVITGNNLY